MTARLLRLPLEEHEHQIRCPACRGRGVTGVRYRMPVSDGGVVMLLDVICPSCGGCGNGHPEHPGCEDTWHAERDDDEVDYLSDDEDPEDECDGSPALCWSCGSDRGWFPVQGFVEEGGNVEMYVLRMPCGCAEERMVEVGEDQ